MRRHRARGERRSHRRVQRDRSLPHRQRRLRCAGVLPMRRHRGRRGRPPRRRVQRDRPLPRRQRGLR
ncbi:hypothetical protein FRC96_12150 [Lujinxingia vulgaris]|uniref:Uncharacterized protein n=1 Tax=Lujinxingia vulgaris TaxID=2600176 RepID=A0A5C6XCT9_9DELT|nr:hypothetical protein FRC96_12150 [Lujinxingia vulgaris]